jgi:hypothetical protein
MWFSVLILGILLRGYLFRGSVTYMFEQFYPLEYRIEPDLENYILFHPEVLNRTIRDLREIVYASEKITADALVFSDTVKTINPNLTFKMGVANDDGFSAFYNTVCDYLLEKCHANKEFDCRHLVGQCYFRKKKVSDMHPPYRISKGFPSKFHFNAIFERKTGKTIALDPTLYKSHLITEVSLYQIFYHP